MVDIVPLRLKVDRPRNFDGLSVVNNLNNYRYGDKDCSRQFGNVPPTGSICNERHADHVLLGVDICRSALFEVAHH